MTQAQRARHVSLTVQPGFVSRFLLRCALVPACVALLCSLPAGAAEVELKPRLYTTGTTVRKAFGDAVREARKSTVEIRIDRKARAFGTIVSDDGLIVTKASELRGEVTCLLNDGRDLPARRIGTDQENDLVLLKIDAAGLTPIEWELSGDPSVGQWVVSAGIQPLPSAVGVVSTERRQIPFEKVYGVIGIKIEDRNGPARVEEVFENGPAASVGLVSGDWIETVAGNAAGTGDEFIAKLRELSPGDEITLGIRRGEEKLSINITLADPDFGPYPTSRVAGQNRMGGRLSPRRTGFDAVIQHDSVLRPHECGGPVVTLSGKAFGINVARAGRTESYALPADVLLPLIDKMKAESSSTTATE